VAWSGSHWPDVIVGGAIASLFLYSAVGVLRGARTAITSGINPSVDSGERVRVRG
jgi:hypothetical protein